MQWKEWKKIKRGTSYASLNLRQLGDRPPLDEMKAELGKATHDTIENIVYPFKRLQYLNGEGASVLEDALYFYHGNHLSSTQLITSWEGDITQAVIYTPFGQVISEYRQDWKLDTIPRFLFTGMERDDESGMDYMSARFYSSDDGTFRSRDRLFEEKITSPYAYCLNNPLRYIDPTGMDEYEVFTNTEGKTQINVVRTDDLTNSYTYINADGERIDLGTYERTDNNMTKLDQNTDFYTQVLYSQGKNYLDGDAAAGFLAAAYNFKQETGDKVKINQLMTADGYHSGKPKSIPCIDVQYPGVNSKVQAETQKVGPVYAVDYEKSHKLVNYMKTFGFNDKGNNNFLTEFGEGGSGGVPALDGTQYWIGHHHHIHIQGFNTSIINVMQK